MIMSGIFAFWLFTNAVLGVIAGAFLGWIFSFTLLGRWIIEGLRAFGFRVSAGNLPQIGAAAGFLSSFFKYSIKPPDLKIGKGGKE
jgi:hypothetical protein